MTVMVVGGAGYIGAHVVRTLKDKGETVIVVDDLSYGIADRVQTVLIEMDVADPANMGELCEAMLRHKVDSVIHFAARKQVGESVAMPAWYYQQNIGGLANVIMAMEKCNVRNIIFSSSAAVYGMPPVDVVSEDIEKHPINPYGETKLIGEWLLKDAQEAFGLKWAALRYFNAAGSGWDDLGDPAVLNLIPMVFDKLAKGEAPMIFGTDYPTPDGTCVRDYIHVSDLATAHIQALDYLRAGDVTYTQFNVGTGQGYSVREVVDMVREVSGIDFTPEIRERRPGDPPHLLGDASRIQQVLGWKAEHDLRDIVTSAWSAWQAGPRRITR
ncbi:MAG: UDP-glucose 4-epimerase GalE [Actinomycetaceae bacterium]|nr:UDP-glucose 4-epimerase GalE [Actinomycetaceae bacterium]